MEKSHSVWLYLLLMFMLYIVWSGLFTEPDIIKQIVVNFAVFYPAGLIAGMKNKASDRHNALKAALFLTLWTYAMAWFDGMKISMILTLTDFISMFAVLYLAFFIAGRNKKAAGDK